MKMSHHDGVEAEGQVLFCTPFGYMFEDAARSQTCLLPVSKKTVDALLKLGEAMGDPGTQADPQPQFDSDIPAIMTYFGQFIDHDLTARTDRETADGGLSISDGKGDVRPGMKPVAPDEIVQQVFNARRPQFDLDSLFGDGPSLIAATSNPGLINTASDQFYEDLRLKVRFGPDGYLDLPRRADGPEAGKAIIGDDRNDENLNVSQFHAAMLRFNNVVFESTHGSSAQSRYSQTRRLVRWAYQYIVVNEYLPAVCDPSIVEDVLLNGPRFYNPAANNGAVFMPLEFSVAGFRFAHSMIRPFYKVNDDVTLNIDEILEPARDRGANTLVGTDHRLKPENVVSWRNYVDLTADVFGGPQRTRLIDPRLAKGLNSLNFTQGDIGKMMAMLAQRNLLRGYLFSIPTGQAVAAQMGIVPMTAQEVTGDDPALAQAITEGGFANRTPLWYYILREAVVHKGGRTLGAVGSRLVAEVIVGLLKSDPNSYLNHTVNRAVTAKGIEITSGFNTTTIGSLADIIRYAGLRK
ncbi:MAG: heme peroxidase family protein [Thalassobaculaceae bacterium]|nr:heme peroxidase family protein [Thalassobaculaceae bacterium]